MITYEVSKADLEYVQSKLKGMEKEAPRVFKNAINRTSTKARKKMVSGVKEAYTVQKASDISSRVKIQRASNRNLSAYVRGQGRTFTIPKFRYEVSAEGVRAEIIRGRGLRNFIGPKGRRAFANPTRTNSEEVMQREGKARKPISILRSVSVPKMLEKVYKGERGMEGELAPIIERTLHDEIEAEVAKLI